MLLKEERNALVIIGQLATLLVKNQWSMATAESCTGGLLAAACTELAGSSAWFERGFVAYSNAAKTELLGVDTELIANHGAVSEEVARVMVQGTLAHARVQVAVAVTCVAGPTGGSPGKPVGLVCFAWATPAGIVSSMRRFEGDRQQVREAAVQHALQALVGLLSSALLPQ